MEEIISKYNKCKIFTDEFDYATRRQLECLMDQESVKDCKIRIMPDCHAGVGCVIGTTMTIKDKIIPNLVGVDISCGMLVIKLKERRIDLPKLDSIIQKYIPSGTNRCKEPKEFDMIDDIIANINKDKALKSIGTLGGGNHFIEVDKGSDGYLWLVIHTGSRYLGVQVCDYYQDIGYNKLKNNSEIPYELSYIEGADFNNYIHDMIILEEYADLNRHIIANVIMKNMKLHKIYEFTTVHNYIDTTNMILRKGAVSAQKDEELIIPINMRDGSLLCKGKGNEDWNNSAPHGAGRLLSRKDAKNSISMKDYKESMKGIYTTCINSQTIDESPFAYKSMQSILNNITDTVEVIDIIKPIYNFKAK